MPSPVAAVSPHAMLLARTAIEPSAAKPYHGHYPLAAVILWSTRQESVMKKFIPLVFIVIMTGLAGVKFAIASEAPTAIETTQQS